MKTINSLTARFLRYFDHIFNELVKAYAQDATTQWIFW